MVFSSTSASKPSTDRLLKCLCISVSGPCKTEVIMSTPQEALIEKHAVIIKMAKTKGKKTTQMPLPGFGSEQAGCSLLWKAAPAPRRSEHPVCLQKNTDLVPDLSLPQDTPDVISDLTSSNTSQGIPRREVKAAEG